MHTAGAQSHIHTALDPGQELGSRIAVLGGGGGGNDSGGLAAAQQCCFLGGKTGTACGGGGYGEDFVAIQQLGGV